MTPPDTGIEQAVLLEQVSWIRRLARELVVDRELAEDLVQETCVVALERAPRESGKLRQWLAEVLRNALRQHARAQGRRLAREARAARPEALEPSDRLVERVLLQRELVNAVLELDEPYRTTVLLRFFEELPPRAIARRTGAPLATVSSRLQRALAKLRARLDGQNQAWAALFLPWVRAQGTLAPPTLVSALMNTKLTLAAAAAIAAGALVWWQASPAAQPAEAPRAFTALDAPPALVAGGGRAAPALPEREALPTSTRGATAQPARAPEVPAPEAWVVRLRVLDAEGLPLAGVAVRAEEREDVLGTSGQGGWCVFQTRAERLVLLAADPRWVTVQQGSPTHDGAFDPVLVLAPAISLAGLVLDAGGQALGGAAVSLSMPEGFHARFTEILEATRPQGWLATSDASGRYAFERVPAVGGARLRAVLAGYAMQQLAAPLVSTSELDFVLGRPVVPLAGVLKGRVLEPGGACVPDARVGLGLASVVSDERGDFVIDLKRAVTSELLSAVKAGFLPARLERPQEPEGERSGWPDDVVLVLGGPALSIRGVVLDHEKKPLSGARVWLHDPTPSAPVGQMPCFLEPQMAGLPIPARALESEANLPAEDGDNFMDWWTNAHAPDGFWNFSVTDAQGAFELGGLDRRAYRLDVLRPDSLELTTSASFQAGETGAVVRLEAPELFETVTGRILSERGEPIPAVSVGLFRPVVDARARVFGGSSQVVIVEYSQRVQSDEAGGFSFARVPKSGARLSIRSDGIVPRSIDVDAAHLQVEVEQRCHLEVVLRPPLERFDTLQVYDGQGERLDILVLTEGSVNAWTDVRLIDGRSGVVSVSSRARELRLFLGGALIERHGLDLVAGDVNRIEL